MFGAFVTCYPWDLLDEELGAKLDHLQGEVGVTGLTLWAACPPVAQIRARTTPPQTTRTRGGLLFHPDEQHYSATRIKPIASGWVKSKHPIEKLRTACDERGLQLRVKVSAALTGRLAHKYSEAACKNLFGAPSHVSLCLFNPDVESYLAALLADLRSNHGVGDVSIFDFFALWGEAFDPELRMGAQIDATLRSLLAMCFCESCQQRAAAREIDVDQAQQNANDFVQSRLEGTTPASASLADLLTENAALESFHRWRIDSLSSLLGRMADDGELILDRGTPTAATDLTIPDSMTVVTEIDNEKPLKESRCVNAQRNELRIPVETFAGSHGTELVNTVAQAVEAGFTGVEFDNYALASKPTFESIRQAIRYARRTASE